MNTMTRVRFAGRLLFVASTAGLIACGGDSADPASPNPPGVPDTIIVSLQTTEVVIGDTVRLSVVARDVNGAVVPNVALTWRSLSLGVATVSADGLVTAIDIGEAEIEVEATVPGSSMALLIDSSRIGTASLRRAKTKFKMFSVPIVVITPKEATINTRQSHLFTARMTDKAGKTLQSGHLPNWSSSKPAIATINELGVATAVAVGATTITASVTVGSSVNVKGTATLTVAEAACGGIASVPTLKGRFFYEYAVNGSLGDSRIASQYGGDVSATMTRQLISSSVVMWRGTLEGSASQMETEHDNNNRELQRIEGNGPPVKDEARAHMIVYVDLTTCIYQVLVEVSIDITWTINGKILPSLESTSARIAVGAGRRIDVSPSAVALQRYFPILIDQELPAHTATYQRANTTQDTFAPAGLAARLIAQRPSGTAFGKANADWSIVVVP